MGFRGNNAVGNTVQVWNGSAWVSFDPLTLSVSGSVTELRASGDMLVSADGGALTLSGGTDLAWPASDGTAGQALITDGSGGLSFASISGSAVIDSELWNGAPFSDARNDEFDSTTLDPAWVVFDGQANAAGSISLNAVDVYDTTFTAGSALRITPHNNTRLSWALLQPPGLAMQAVDQTGFVLNKPITVPTNLLVWARLKFNIKNTIVNDDGAIGIALGATNGGIWDRDNQLICFLNEPNTDVKAQGISVIASSPANVGTTTNAARAGQALEYVAIHKIGTTYHFWAGTQQGSWIWIGSTTTAVAFDRVGIFCINVGGAAPGVTVTAVDFIRFQETDNFLL